MFPRRRHLAPTPFLILLTCTYFSVKVNAYWSPFGASSKQVSEEQTNQYKFESANTLLRAESVSVPTRDALIQNGMPNSWCAKAARAAEKKCNLLIETERMQMATLVANCHLETINRPPVLWDPKHGLRDVSDDHQTLVIVVANQLETHCSSFGVSWSHASVTEIQEHLSELRFAAEQLTNSTAESVDTAERIEVFSTKLEKMQSAFVAHAKTFEGLSSEVSHQLKLIKEGERKATELYLGAEEKFRAFGTSLSQSMQSLPEAANTFLKNSERFEALLHEQSRLANLQGAPATTTSFLIAAFIVSAGFLYSGRPFFLLFLSVTVFVLKVLAEAEKDRSRGRVAALFFDPFYLLTEAGCFVLSLIPHQALALSASMAIGWVFSPEALQKSFMGDRSMLASARLEAAEAKALAHERETKCQKLEEEISTQKVNLKTAASTISQLEKKVQTKDRCIQSLEKKVRDNANLHRDMISQLLRSKAEADSQKEKAQTYSAQTRELLEQNEKLKAESENFESNMADKDNEIERQIASLRALEEQRNEDRARQFGNASKALRDELQTIQVEVAELKARNHALQSKCTEVVFTLRDTEAVLKAKDAELLQKVRAHDEMTAELERKEQEMKVKDAELKNRLTELRELQHRDIELEKASTDERRGQQEESEEPDSLTTALHRAKQGEEAAWRKVAALEERVNELQEINERDIDQLLEARSESRENAAAELNERQEEIDALRKKVHDFETLENRKVQELEKEKEALRTRLLHLEERETSTALELANIKKRQQRSNARPQIASRSKSFCRSDKNMGGLGSRQVSVPYVNHDESSDDEVELRVGAGPADSSGAGPAESDEALQHNLDTPPARATRGGASSGRSHATNAADNEYRNKLRSHTPLKRRG